MCIFAGTLPATRLAVTGLDPFFLTVARAAIAGMAGFAVIALTKRRIPLRSLWLEFALRRALYGRLLSAFCSVGDDDASGGSWRSCPCRLAASDGHRSGNHCSRAAKHLVLAGGCYRRGHCFDIRLSPRRKRRFLYRRSVSAWHRDFRRYRLHTLGPLDRSPGRPTLRASRWCRGSGSVMSASSANTPPSSSSTRR